MIRNIIFDLGNVLLSFKPEEYLKENFPADKAALILKDIFMSTEWRMLDQGIISVNEATELIERKSALSGTEIAFVFNLRSEMMFPLDENVKLLEELKKESYSLYYLSNFHSDIFIEFYNKYSFFRNFVGGVVSADVKVNKPDPEIYRILIDKYNLHPRECFFIDDTEENVKTAISFGMKGYFTNGCENLNFGDLLKKMDFLSL